MRLKVRHNMEVAHRLSEDTTKCKQIHGHGMLVELVFLNLEEGPGGMATTRFGRTMEFGSMKRVFRNYIDSKYDHHLLLNKDDPFTSELVLTDPSGVEWRTQLPGLTKVPGEPTVENLAKWIVEWACAYFECDVICRIEETRTNGAEVFATWNGETVRVQK